MTRLIQRMILAVLFFGFTTSQTSAACAWILWSSRSVSVKPNEEMKHFGWEPHAFETRKECETARQEWIKNIKEQPDMNIKPFGPDTLIVESGSTKWIQILKCLPDTVKPN